MRVGLHQDRLINCVGRELVGVSVSLVCNKKRFTVYVDVPLDRLVVICLRNDFSVEGSGSARHLSTQRVRCSSPGRLMVHCRKFGGIKRTSIK